MIGGMSATAAPHVAVIEDAPWSPNDPSREGAAEFGIMLRIAQLQTDQSSVGIVGVGDKRGIFQEGTRRGLELAVQHGVPVVRLARGLHPCLKSADDLFIDGGLLTPEAASALLVDCLSRHGALPCVSSAENSSGFAAELARLRQKLKLYQSEFSAHQPELVAVR